MSNPQTPSTNPTTGNMIPVKQRSSSSLGCWVIGIITVIFAAGLVAVALFLPPFNLLDRLTGTQYAYLNSAGDSIATDDGTFRVAAASDAGEGGFGVDLDAISINRFDSASGEDGWIQTARSNLPHHLSLQSPVYSIDTTGSTPDSVMLGVAVPQRTVPDLLDLYGYDVQSGRWTFIPAEFNNSQLQAVVENVPDRVAVMQAAPQPPVVLVSHDVTQMLNEDVASLATIVSPGGLQPASDGRIIGSLAPGFDLNAGYLTMPSLRNYSVPSAIDTETTSSILSNSGVRNTHAREIAQFALNGGFEGVFIDYRGIQDFERDAFSEFIEEAATALHTSGLKLGVVVPQPETTDGFWETGGYDWQAIGANADYVQIETGLNPHLFQPGDEQFIEAMSRWAVQQIARDKILLGITARSIREIAGVHTPVGFDQAIAGLGNVVVEASATSETGSIEPGTEVEARLDGYEAAAGVEERISAPYIDYLNEDGSTAARMWLSTGDAIRHRMDATIPFALAGVAFDDLMHNDLADDALQAIVNFKTQIPGVPAATDIALNWRIEDANGVVDEIVTDLNESLVITLEAPDGNYAINTSVIGIGRDNVRSERSGAAVALFRPTATPTPLPTSTPAPTPTVTPTPAPIIPTNAPAGGIPGGGGSSAAPGSGSIQAGAFEYGGHVTSAGSERAVAAMRQAGMNWMKVQIRYSPGASPEIAAGDINAAKQNGFKILIGVVGNPNDLRAGGENYVNSFAGWLGGIAALGADAIEVWNEPNLDREWPTGEISGAAYADMLRRSYQAIKQRNGGVMVISAAPAPNGAEAAFPGQVMNDDRWMRQFVDAGGLNYTDCVGLHYNEGVVGPTATSGDFRDNYYTRYLPTYIEVVNSIVAGRKPLCFTELGYVTPEGYPPLPGFFAWGQNTTVAQQAAWLAQAAAYLSQRGNVRMMIVWNIDFRQYASDPQGGYAIIRPDGSCPACNALAGAR